MSSQIPDPSTPSSISTIRHRYIPFVPSDLSTSAGTGIARSLQDELFIWLTTVDEEGTPHPLPVGFLWDEAQSTLLIYSALEGDRDRLAHIRHNSRVCLHFNFDANSREVMIITGEAFVSENDPSSDQVPAWVAKYQDFFSRFGMTMQQAAAAAPVPLRIRPLKRLITEIG